MWFFTSSPVFAKNTYEYNVYESKKNRFLVVSPAQGAPDTGREKSRPSDFSVYSANGDEIFYVKWRPGTCIHPGVVTANSLRTVSLII